MSDFLENFERQETDKLGEFSLDAKWTDEYVKEHQAELIAEFIKAGTEKGRAELMEEDADRKGSNVLETLKFAHGKTYEKALGAIMEVFDESERAPVSERMLQKAESVTGRVNPQQLIHDLKFSSSEQRAICKVTATSIFEMMGINPEDQPEVKIISKREHIPEKYSRTTRGTFRSPSRERIIAADLSRNNLRERMFDGELDGRTRREKNGVVAVFLPNFKHNDGFDDVLETLAHECFHAYQMNSERQTVPIRTIGDLIKSEAYRQGMINYVSSRESHARYFKQGYESSARRFAKNIKYTLSGLVAEALPIEES